MYISCAQAVNLERFTERRIVMVIRRALLICTALFSSLAAAGVFLFGTATEANILLNLRPEVVQDYIGEVPATLLCFCIRLAYCLCLMVSHYSTTYWHGTFHFISKAEIETHFLYSFCAVNICHAQLGASGNPYKTHV